MDLISLNISYLFTLLCFLKKIKIKKAIRSLPDDSIKQTTHISDTTDICTIDSLFKNFNLI